jgi:hypothetical protein
MNDDVTSNEEGIKKIVACVVLIATILKIKRNRARGYSVIGRNPNVFRDRKHLDQKILSLPNDTFKKMYRLHKIDFLELLNKISHSIEPTYFRNNTITPVIKLAITLRYLAGGSFLDLSFGYEIPHNTIHQYFYEVVEAIDNHVDNIQFPLDDYDKLVEMEREFSQIGSFLRGTVAAGDGVVFKIKRPQLEDVDGNVTSFFQRKGYYAYAMQVK